MSVEYVRAAMWHAYLHGLRGMETWFWSRYWNITLPDLEPAREFQGSILTMPHVLNAYAQTGLMLRRLSKQVVPFAQENSRVKLFFSEPSRLLSSRFNKELVTAYEGMYFLDNQVRFLTDTQAANGITPDTALIIVPFAPYVGDAAYQSLLQYAKNGGRILLVGDEVLGYSERGELRDTAGLKACPGVISAASMSREQYRDAVETQMTTLVIDRPVRLLNEDGSFADRIESRTVRRDGRYMTYIINLDTKERAVKITKNGVPVLGAFDMIRNGRIDTSSLHLKRLEVLLLSLD